MAEVTERGERGAKPDLVWLMPEMGLVCGSNSLFYSMRE